MVARVTTKPILVLDFDGVIHSYERGWEGGQIYGTVVPGFFEWAAGAKNHFRLAIYSSRSDSHKNIKPMMDWLTVHLRAWHWEKEESGKEKEDLEIHDFEFPMRKPPAFVTIDDRAITFTGDWSKPELNPLELKAFKSWVQQ